LITRSQRKEAPVSFDMKYSTSENVLIEGNVAHKFKCFLMCYWGGEWGLKTALHNEYSELNYFCNHGRDM